VRQLRSTKLIEPPRHKLSSADWRAFSVAVMSVWNYLADYLRDPALGFISFRRQLKDIHY